MSFRKRKNKNFVPDVFEFEVSKVSKCNLHGVETTRTTRSRVSNLDKVFEPVPSMPPLGELRATGVSLKDVPCEGLLDSRDNLDYNTEGLEEKVFATLEKATKKTKKKEVSSTND